ncbi:MAG: hydroxymethylbilane synthase, partial [Deltaproteobacteria bacterium]|nr:hydroxymethylbilane synthase [Deltaproteobacteria bacterium]
GVAARLPAATRIHRILTSGDRFRDIPLQGGSQTGFFTKEIEDRLLSGEVDIAVHSLKDLPTMQPAGLWVAACLERASVSDLLIVHPDWLDSSRLLPVREGCRVGAGSLRRQALVRLYGPVACPTLIRGNVPTRLRKCRDGEYGAVLLARAGVERLGLDLAGLHVFEMNPRVWLPAPGQGAVAVEVRAEDEGAGQVVETIDHGPTHAAVRLERRLLVRFEGGCHTAFGALARPMTSGAWRVRIGIDRGPSGWGQLEVEGTAEECAALSPKDIPSFSSIRVDDPAALRTPFPG